MSRVDRGRESPAASEHRPADGGAASRSGPPTVDLPAEGSRLAVARWALRLIRDTSPGLLAGLGVTTVVRGMLPAALALTIRGLINAAVAVLDRGGADIAPLLPWLALGFVLTLIDALGRMANRLFLSRLEDDLDLRVTGDIISHAAKLELAVFEDPAREDMVARTRLDGGTRFARLVTEGQKAITHLIVSASLLAVLTAIEPLVPVVVAPFALPFLFFQWRLSRARYREEYSRATKRRWTTYFVSKLTEADSVAETKLFDLAPLLSSRLRRTLEGFRERNRDLHWRNFRGSAIAAALAIVALYALFLKVAIGTLQGSVTVGDLAIFGGATARLRFAVDDAIRSLANSMEQTLFISNLVDFFRLVPEPTATAPGGAAGDASGLLSVDRLQPIEVELRGVTFSYPGSGSPAVRDVSLTVVPGETLAIVGENGAGKTTLVKLLARLYDPDGGVILFDGVDVRSLPPEEHRRRLSFVLQSFGRYEASVGENIAYGDWRRMLDDPGRVEEVARRTGLHPTIERLPRRYDTWVGREFGEHTLSGGGWQKVAVARAFARDASLLVLDEPTASLDASAEYDLFCRFKELARGRTTILISHRFSTLGMADRIGVMKDGRLVELGTHEELLSRPGAYAALYGFHERLRPRGGSRVAGKMDG